MNKMGRMLVVIVAIMVQVILGLLYGFSGVSVSAGGCFVIWCVCAAIIYRLVGVTGTV